MSKLLIQNGKLLRGPGGKLLTADSAAAMRDCCCTPPTPCPCACKKTTLQTWAGTYVLRPCTSPYQGICDANAVFLGGNLSIYWDGGGWALQAAWEADGCTYVVGGYVDGTGTHVTYAYRLCGGSYNQLDPADYPISLVSTEGTCDYDNEPPPYIPPDDD